jgi:hypothetical protein
MRRERRRMRRIFVVNFMNACERLLLLLLVLLLFLFLFLFLLFLLLLLLLFLFMFLLLFLLVMMMVFLVHFILKGNGQSISNSVKKIFLVFDL